MEKEASRHISLDRNEFLVTIGGARFRVALTGEESATVNGTTYEFNIRGTAEGTDSMILRHVVYETAVLSRRAQTGGEDGTADGAEIVRVSVNGTDFETTVDDQRSLLIKSLHKVRQRDAHAVLVRAPMPGLIARILVEPGQTVHAGQGMIVLEAMKMENELRAVQAGRIDEIFVQTGRAVEKDERLLLMTVE
jgi:biotin carboxyl carrier protein